MKQKSGPGNAPAEQMLNVAPYPIDLLTSSVLKNDFAVAGAR